MFPLCVVLISKMKKGVFICVWNRERGKKLREKKKREIEKERERETLNVYYRIKLRGGVGRRASQVEIFGSTLHCNIHVAMARQLY